MRRLLSCAVILALSSTTYAGVISESEPNNTFGTAQNVNGGFSLFFDPNVADSATSPHVTILGTGNGTLDFYRFTVSLPGPVTIDIDSTPNNTNFDTMIHLWDAAGNLLATQDDNGGDPGDGPGIIGGAFNSKLALNLTPGDYVVGVGTFFSSALAGPSYTNPPANGTTYTLNISVSAPEPGTLAVLGLAAVSFAGFGYRRMRNA